jgi:hypothetical protein
MAAPSSLVVTLPGMTVPTTDTTWSKLLQARTIQNSQIISNQLALSLKNPETGTIQRNQGTPADTAYNNAVNIQTCY